MMAIMFSFGYSSFIIFLVFGCLLIHDYQMWPQILPIQLIPSSILTHIVTAMHTLCIFVLLLLQHNIQANLGVCANAVCFKHDNIVCACAVSVLILINYQ